MTSEIKVDTISEQTSANGVTIDGLTIKDGNIIGDVALAGTTPTFTIGDAGAEDASLIFDGNAQDFYVALDDSADDLVIGLGNTIGTTPIMSFDESKNVTIHDGTLKVESDNANNLVAPLLQLDRISSSPADGDLIGAIRYTARLDNGNSAEFAGLEAKIIESSTADGEITLNIAKGGNVRSAIKANNTEVIINDASEDIDFRVESNGNTNMFTVNAGTSRVGMITAPDLGIGLHIRESDTSGNIDAWADLLVLEGNSDSGMTILTGPNKDGSINFGDSADNDAGRIVYNHNSNELGFYNGGANRWRINTTGNLIPGAAGLGIHLGVSAATASNLLDDYEEGTFAYTIVGSTSGNLVLRSGYARGSYVKIGNLVHVDIRFETSSDNSISGNLRWSLPFTMATPNGSDADSAVAPGYIRDNSMGTNARTGVYLVGEAEAYVQLLFSRETAANSTVELANDGNTDGVMEGTISITYRTT